MYFHWNQIFVCRAVKTLPSQTQCLNGRWRSSGRWWHHIWQLSTSRWKTSCRRRSCTCLSM